MELLKVEHVSKIYGAKETQVKALDDVSFTVEKGEFVAIVGPSGSGKSTLLHILGGVDRPTSGQIILDGNAMYQMDEDGLAIFRRRQIGRQSIYEMKERELTAFRRREIGQIYQFYNLIPVLNVKENITLPLLLDQRKVNEDYFQKLVQQLGLQDRLNYLPNQLSGGQQQRVSICRAIMASPAVVLADEPTGNLDRKNSEEIVGLLKQLHREQKQTLIMITHDESIALQADRILQIEDGKIVKDEVIRR